MSWLLRKRVLLLLLIALVLFLFLKSDWIGRKMYPVKYTEDIKASAGNYKMDPYLIAAIIRVETNYTTGKVSSKGALGIMQLMPETADWIIEKADFTKVSRETLAERADVNIEAGVWYLRSLHEKFDGNSVAAVAAYNAGPGNVNKWISSGVWDGSLESVRNLPFGETRHYVQRVIYYYNKYKQLYPELKGASL
ncbi:lytic transglycosylase domain-containing protein [Paenibacillus beijingensis]|uniref:Lytic transglycosylase n=1 Tax=Paenibacillus beijingensis TaxID=1126833 RepID=A0A0D5NF05_9BACL|nr:lytic transglycosylase domain-containing protein [Paenibacillus beijingensis]AJY73562.1 lytic transglycosylase [Paenibacillus beijingensis]